MEWTNENTVEINGVLVEREWALPQTQQNYKSL